MGAKYQLVCGSCGYEAMVSGGDDFGFNVHATTIVCEDCRELCDVVTARFPPYPHDPDFEQDEPECPKDPAHTVRRWRAPGLCPNCGQQMAHGEQWLLWD